MNEFEYTPLNIVGKKKKKNLSKPNSGKKVYPITLLSTTEPSGKNKRH